MIRFTPLMITTLTRDVLRRCFQDLGVPEFCWDEDPKKSKILIGTMDDYHQVDETQKLPRLLVGRGAIASNMTSLSNNLLSSTGKPEDYIKNFRRDVRGSVTLIVEASNFGTCEVIADIARTFISWCKPMIESQFGFQGYAREFQVSECMADREDTEKFKIQITLPYIVEDTWITEEIYVKLKNIFTQLTS